MKILRDVIICIKNLVECSVILVLLVGYLFLLDKSGFHILAIILTVLFSIMLFAGFVSSVCHHIVKTKSKIESRSSKE